MRVITQDYKVRRINPRHLVLAVRGDEELDTLMDKVVFPGGGVIPHIHKSLIGKCTATLLIFNCFSISLFLVFFWSCKRTTGLDRFSFCY